jgi:hypothetical protein
VQVELLEKKLEKYKDKSNAKTLKQGSPRFKKQNLINFVPFPCFHIKFKQI